MKKMGQKDLWKIMRGHVAVLMVAVALSLGITACQSNELFGGKVNLVKDGKPVAEIVLAKDAIPATKLAATDFQKHIKLISGAELPIVDKPGDKTAVYIGDSEYTRKLGVTLDDIKNSGYKVIVKDNYVILAGRDLRGKSQIGDEEWRKFAGENYGHIWVGPGNYVPKLGIYYHDDTGSLYATSDLLEQLGVRWYMPYEIGTVIPALKDISVKNQNLKKESKYTIRYSSFYGTFGDKSGQLSFDDAVLWLKHMKYGNAVGFDGGPHGVVSILGSTNSKTTAQRAQEHPEYFARDSSGNIIHMEGGGKPRLTNPEFRRSTLNYMDKVFQAYPSLSTVMLGMPDGFTTIDESDSKLFPPDLRREAKFSAYVWDYWLWAAAELKKSHPGKSIGVLSYTTYQEPPPSLEKVPDNIMLYFMNVTCLMAQSSTKAYMTGLRDKWLKKFSPGTTESHNGSLLLQSRTSPLPIRFPFPAVLSQPTSVPLPTPVSATTWFCIPTTEES